MIWIATFKDGTVVRQYESSKYKSSVHLDRDKIEKFRITETSGNIAAQFNADSGLLKFNNLDYKKLVELKGGEKLVFVYDKESESFKLGEKSLEFIRNLTLKDERDYFYIEFDQTGRFYISGQELYLGYVTNDGREMPFINQPPYNQFKYTITSNEDFYMNCNEPVKKMNYITSYALRLDKEHRFDNVVFDVSHSVVFDVLKNCVMLNSTISCNTHLKGNLYMIFGGQRQANPLEFYPGEKKYIPKMLSLL